MVVALAAIATILPAVGSRIAGASVRLQSVPGNPAPEAQGASPTGPAPAGASLPLVVGPTPLSVAVSGTQTYGGAASFGGSESPPAGVSVDTTGLSCATVGDSTPSSATLNAGSYTLKPSSCSGVTLSGANAADYGVAYTSAADDFTVEPVTIATRPENRGVFMSSPLCPPRPSSGITCVRASILADAKPSRVDQRRQPAAALVVMLGATTPASLGQKPTLSEAWLTVTPPLR